MKTDTEWLDFNEENLERFSRLYVDWREQFIIKAKNAHDNI